MLEFPRLRTGAVLQYPVETRLRHQTVVLHFVDGSEQRYRGWKRVLRRWVVRLRGMTEEELAELEDFWRVVESTGQTFAFRDPWTGVTYPRCRFDGDRGEFWLKGEDDGELVFVIREEPL